MDISKENNVFVLCDAKNVFSLLVPKKSELGLGNKKGPHCLPLFFGLKIKIKLLQEQNNITICGLLRNNGVKPQIK